MTTRTTIKRQTTLAAVLLGAALMLGLQGCSSGGGDPTPEPVIPTDQDASGLYKDGTIALDGGATMASDLIGFVENNRLMAFSLSSKVVIDGIITAPVLNDFSGVVNVYVNGQIAQTDVVITGQVTSQSSLSADLAGTGAGNGNMTLTFDPLYSRGATFERIEAILDDTAKPEWAGTNYGIETGSVFLMIVNITGNMEGGSVADATCTYNQGTVTIPSNSANVYEISADLGESMSDACTGMGDGFTGFATVIDGDNGTDTKTVHVITDGSYSFFAILER